MRNALTDQQPVAAIAAGGMLVFSSLGGSKTRAQWLVPLTNQQHNEEG